MADKPQVPRRKVYVTFFEHAVERTEEQIRELKAGGLFVRDAEADAPLPSHLAPRPAAPQPAAVTTSAPGAKKEQ